MKETMKAAGSAFKSARDWAIGIFVGLIAMSVLTVFLGGSNSAALAAIVVVIGGEIILRRRKKKSAKFGEVARGSEVADHTKARHRGGGFVLYRVRLRRLARLRRRLLLGPCGPRRRHRRM